MGVKISVCVRNEISGSPIDNVYVKSSLSMSNFLNCLLTKLRISAHSLPIETGRYNNILKEQRFCKHCPTSVENESRFILHVYIVPGLTICGLLEIIKKYFPLQGLMPISLRTF